ncbi:MAG: Fe-S cluster assembly ATPase SufC [Candidatus Dadabacteria bacterium]|nr:MAG: Fe-S cluster assembly ATPase SufC [Candidatus Dadabacteria bacterium]
MSEKNILEIKDLYVSVEKEENSTLIEILKGVNLSINQGEIHAIMGTNGSGKSTLANVLAGKPDYIVTKGSVHFLGEDLLELSPEERAQKGLFMAFQYPVELPGVAASYFLRTAYNSIRKARGEPEMKLRDFNKIVQEKAKELDINPSLLQRGVNEGFSGGEKKRHEILQLAVLDPLLAILDETDSGLDIDALQIVAKGVNTLKSKDPKKSFLVITHYQRILNYIKPDFVHIMLDGKIVKSGSEDLALEVESKGYSWLQQSC